MRECITRILIAEDDHELAMLVIILLRQEGFEVVHVETGHEAVEAAQEGEYALIIMDMQMDDAFGNKDNRAGLRASEKIRELGITTPIIFLTAFSDNVNELDGLRVGDDFVAKPYESRVLIARVHAVLRRFNRAQNTKSDVVYKTGDLTFHTSKLLLKMGDKIVKGLTPTEKNIVSFMLQHMDYPLSSSDIYKAGTGESFIPHNVKDIVSTHINNIRTKIGPPSVSFKYIATERGVGYKAVYHE